MNVEIWYDDMAIVYTCRRGDRLPYKMSWLRYLWIKFGLWIACKNQEYLQNRVDNY